MGRATEDIIIRLQNDFSALNILSLFKDAGVMEKMDEPDEFEFSQLVYLRSTTGEVYGKAERDFVKNIDKVFVFPEESKKLGKEKIVCRVVAADLSNMSPDIYSAVMFMKIAIKALDGWILFLLRLSDGLHFGMRIYERDEKKNCTICETQFIENVLDELSWNDDNYDFLSFYNSMLEAVTPKDLSRMDFDLIAIKRMGYRLDYIEGLTAVGEQLGLDFSYEIERYKSWYEEEIENAFFAEYEDALEDTKNIKSSQVNTLEILFEAEELEKVIQEKEEKNIWDVAPAIEKYNGEVIPTDLVKNDPEAIIRLLKAKKGII